MMLSMMALTSQGWAFPFVDQTFRVSHEVDLDDADLTSGNGEDYFTTNDAYWARHAAVVLMEAGPFPQSVDMGFTDGDGLITFTNLDKAKQYILVLRGHHDHKDSGRDLVIVDANDDIETAQTDPFFLTSSSHLGGPPTTMSFGFVATAGSEWINAAAIGSWVIRRMPNPFPTNAQNGAVYTIKMDDPENCLPGIQNEPPAGYCSPQEAVFLDPTNPYAWKNKWVIAHEFGHELEHWALVPSPTSLPHQHMYVQDHTASSSVNGCRDFDNTHSYVSYEYQSAAITEGLADYVAAVAFNRTVEDDCRFYPGGPYEWVEGFDDILFEDQFSCEGYDSRNTGNLLGTDNGGIEDYYGIPAGNLFEHDPIDPIGEPANEPCSDNTVTTNRGTELDWLRFFWDVDNKLGLVAADIFDAWVAADPVTWNATGDVPDADNPADRMEDAMVDSTPLNQSGWDNWAGSYVPGTGVYGNGVDR